MELRDFLDRTGAGGSSGESGLVSNVVLVMKEFGYTAAQMAEMAAPTFITLLEELRKNAEREERAMKKGRK